MNEAMQEVLPILVQALGRTLIGVVIVWLTVRLVVNRLRRVAARTATSADDRMLKGLSTTVAPLGYLASVLWGWKHLLGQWKVLEQEQWIDQFVEGALLFIAIVLVVRLVNRSLLLVLDRSLRRLGKEKQLTLLQGLQPMIRTAVWILGLLVFLQSRGVALGAIYASLAGAGIGIGLALREPISNFINYLTILIDEPFQIGHFVKFDDVLGAVERVGIRSSSIRSLSGERIEISNGELLNKTIFNFGDLPKRRVATQIGVIYQTPVEKVAAIPGMIKEVIRSNPPAEYDRCHFIQFADSSLLFEFVYFIPDQDMVVYLDAQHAINVGIIERFEREGIDFAYPTRTLFIANPEAEASAQLRTTS